MIHGEPERPRRSRPIHRHRRREPEILAKKEEEQEDLFADKLKQGRSSSREQAIDDEEEDLFADKLKRSRSRSPTRSELAATVKGK